MRFWNTLNPREKTIIGVGLPAVLGVVFYLYYWQPYHESIASLKVDVPQKRAVLAWMEHQISAAGPLLGETSSSQVNTAPILTIIENRAISAKVKSTIQRVQPDGNDQVRVWFQDVEADNWFRFIDLLTDDGIAVESATVTRSTQGLINVRVTFQR